MIKRTAAFVAVFALGLASYMGFRAPRIRPPGPKSFNGVKIGNPARPESPPTITFTSPSNGKLEVRRGQPIDCLARLQLGNSASLPSVMVFYAKRDGKTALSAFPILEPKGDGAYDCKYQFKNVLRKGTYELGLECEDWVKNGFFATEIKKSLTVKATAILIIK